MKKLLLLLLLVGAVAFGQVINVTGSLTSFGQVVVTTTSGEQTFSVDGSSLGVSDMITVTAPSGFEVSLSSGSGFASSVQTAGADGFGSIAATTIYVHFSPTLQQAYSGNIVCSAPLVTSVSVAAAGTGMAAEPTGAPTVDTYSPVRATSIKINFTAGTGGSGRIVVVRATSAVDFVPVDGTTYTANTNFTLGTAVGTLCKIVYAGSGSSVVVTNLSASTTYYVAVYEYNGTGTSINYFDTPGTGNQATTAATALTGPTYTIGTSGDFPTLSGAFAELNTSGVGAALTFYFIDNSYTESANIALGCTGTSVTNTLTFKPFTGTTPTINFTQLADNAGPSGLIVIGSNTTASYTLVKTDYVIIDGSNTNGGTTRDLSITNVDNSVAFQYGIRIVGDNDNITIKNINLTLTETGGTSTYGILFTVRNQSATNYVPDNGIVENCNIIVTGSNAGQCIAVSNSGTVTTGLAASGMIFRNNTLTARTRGIFLNYAQGFSIYGNTISVNQTNSGSLSHGIYAFSTNGITSHTCNIYNNKLIQLSSANTTAGVFGISGITLEVAGTFNVYNNFVSGFSYATSTNGSLNGIRVSTASASFTGNLYHNTIYLGDVGLSDSLIGININSATFAGVVNIKNNIIAMEDPDAATFCINRASNSTGTYTSNYNDLYSTGSSAQTGYWGASGAQANLATWQSTTSQDANSKSVAVTFAGATDLHLAGGSNGDVNLTGVTGLGVSTDIDGETRSVTAPYMGADEASTPVPVEISSFTSVARGKNVELKWKTATEVNNHGFEVEKLVNGIWSKIGFVQGAGNSNSPKEYGYVDAVNANGTYSYRLKQIDNNGKFTYNNAIEVNVNAVVSSYELAQNFPNPFNPTTTIRFSVKQMEQTSVKVYDVTGREVTTLFSGVASPGQVYNVQFNGAGLASGIYFYVLQTQSHRDVKKMSLLK